MHSGDKSSILCSYLVHVLAQAQKNKNKSTQKRIPHISGNGTIYISRNRDPFPSHFLPPPPQIYIYIYFFIFYIFSKESFSYLSRNENHEETSYTSGIGKPEEIPYISVSNFPNSKNKKSLLPHTHTQKKDHYISGNGTF